MKHTIEQLRYFLNYDSETGSLTWKNPPKRASMKGKNACLVDTHSRYLYVLIEKERYQATRLVWAIHYGEWPNQNIKIIDKDINNISINNLKPSTQSEILINKGVNGAKGAFFFKGKWTAAISFNYKRIHLGTFDTQEEASKAYQDACNAVLSGGNIPIKERKRKTMNIFVSPSNWNQQYTTPEQFITELQEDGFEYEGVEFNLVQIAVQGCIKFKIAGGKPVVIGHTTPIGFEGR